jgi:Uma2 family endonuclease
MKPILNWRLASERRYTIEDYFSIEESSAIKHEFLGGDIFAMAGTSLQHNRINGNVYTALRTRLQLLDCEVFSSDLRLRTPGGLYTYPDLMVVCGNIELSPTDRLDTILNPAVIIEILSESTRNYDRGEKFRLYLQLPSLLDYMLIEQGMPLVDHYTLTTGGNQLNRWTQRQHTALNESVALESLGIELPLSDIYTGVDFDDAR